MVGELIDDVKEEIVFFSKCGFYDKDEILETIEDEFIDFDVNLDLISHYLEKTFNKYQQYTNSEDFNNLQFAFDDLNKNGIISIHNNAYDIQEGVDDAFEVYTHLLNNKYSPIGFCFYTLSDLEELFENQKLSLSYGSFDFEDEIKKSQIEDLIENTFKKYEFDIKKSDEQFIIYNFNWIKVYDNKEYSMEGAYEDFIKFNKKEV
ncbi:DUF6891 domain-containing protein [uncultured Methanobrevibacter sp.]|uniref:DUF6891 domain-containing protein n=1 Tax=uncultured Methanobrevibacter sp. TaxID=253161 RepID=UPI0025DC3A0D|nr:hypothetical protein [uncultured Methanobrevibacter sp.]